MREPSAAKPPDWASVAGCTPEQAADRLYGRRPGWVSGTISHFDARYLLERTLESGASTIIEVGTASGVSTAVLCRGLEIASAAGVIGTAYQVRSYDLNEDFYADRSKRIGDATREMLEPHLLQHIVFRSRVTAVNVADDTPADSVRFAFIDANHRHPWPCLDVLAILDCLRPGAEVVLHDINLPLRYPEDSPYGVKYLFDHLDVPKAVDQGDPVPNIGSFWIPEDKQALRKRLREIIDAHEWEAKVWDGVTSRLLA